jgi:hypothetical protein
MREVIKDILSHTYGLGFITELKVTGDEEGTLVETMDENNFVVIKGSLKEPIAEFEGEFGVCNLDILKQIVEYPNHKADGATVEVVNQERKDKEGNAKIVPERVVFKDEKGTPWLHRFMAAELVREQFDFVGAKWTIEVTPTRSEIQEFRYKTSTYASTQPNFLVKTVDGELRFYVGGQEENTYVAISTEEPVKFKNEHKWSVNHVLSVLKLDEGNAKLSFLDDARMAALQITVTTDYATWLYIFPAVRD